MRFGEFTVRKPEEMTAALLLIAAYVSHRVGFPTVFTAARALPEVIERHGSRSAAAGTFFEC